MRDFSHKLVPLLEDNIRVMIYAGKAATCLVFVCDNHALQSKCVCFHV